MKPQFSSVYLLILLIVLCTLFFSKTAIGRERRIKGQIIDYGVISSKGSTPYIARDAEAGYATLEDSLHVVRRTDTLVLQEGLYFGIDWEISGFKPNSEVAITYTVKHPRLKDHMGRYSFETIEELTHYVDENGRFSSVDGFCLCEKNFLVPGLWTIAIGYDKRVIIEKSFLIQEAPR